MKNRLFIILGLAALVLLLANLGVAQTPAPITLPAKTVPAKKPAPAKPADDPSDRSVFVTPEKPSEGAVPAVAPEKTPTRSTNGRNGNGAEGAGDIMDHHTARVQVDGNVLGVLFTFDDAGNVVYVREKIDFIQNKKVVYSATSNEWGRFQVPGMQPGVYSAIAYGPPGLGVAKVRVLPYDPAVQNSDFVLHMTVIPLPDAEWLPKVVGELPVAGPAVAPTPPTAAAAAGGAGGGAAIAAGLGALGAGMGSSFGASSGGGGGVSQFVPK